MNFGFRHSARALVPRLSPRPHGRSAPNADPGLTRALSAQQTASPSAAPGRYHRRRNRERARHRLAAERGRLSRRSHCVSPGLALRCQPAAGPNCRRSGAASGAAGHCASRRAERLGLDRAGAMLLLAGHEAWVQSGWEPAEDLPLVLGTTAGGMSLGEAYFRAAVQEPHRHRQQPTRALALPGANAGPNPRRRPWIQRAHHHHFERLRFRRQRHRPRLGAHSPRPG